MNSGFLRVVTWNTPNEIFRIVRGFFFFSSIFQQITVSIKFLLHLIDLVICVYLHDLNII